MAILLKVELEAIGWTKTVEQFRELIADVFANMFPSWTDEDLLCNPREAIRFCRNMQHASALPDLSEALILRTLTNCRKNTTIIHKPVRKFRRKHSTANGKG